MTTSTEPMPTVAEQSALSDGRLVPALLQAVREQGIAPKDAHFAFPLAVPMVAARLNLSARSILVVTESGAALYGPGGDTIAELCEQEAAPDGFDVEPDDVDVDPDEPLTGRDLLFGR
jgi:hypothetical protein